MTDTKWTPGPWVTSAANRPIDGEFDWCIAAIIDGKPRIIGEAYGRAATNVRPNAEANARLISAAPDMAEALENIIKRALLLLSFGLPREVETVLDEIGGNARSALAKARGEA